MKSLREKIYLITNRLKYTCQNLTVHGPSFLVRKDINFIYKFVYFIIYINVWIAAVASVYKYISTYQEDTIRFVTRTDYLDWNTTFPSVTICETPNTENILPSFKNIEKENEDDVTFAKEVAFFSGECRSCNLNQEKNTQIFKEIFNSSSFFRSDCKDMFISCTWDDKPMNCCKHFKAIQTEYGMCYSMNNNQIAGNHLPLYVASSNRRKLGILELALSKHFEAFLHSPDDVPYWNMEQDRRAAVLYGSIGSMLFSIVDIGNEPEVSLTAPDVRKCRFPNELPANRFKGYRYYSYSVCIIQCRIEAQLELCNCTSHLSPLEYKDRYCDLEGLNCLTKHYNSLKKLKLPGVSETGLNCDCLSSCTESDYNIIAKQLSEAEREITSANLKFILGNRPYERVTRQVARTALDLVVAIGSCFGLCFGGSLLSIVEVFYFVFFKQWKYTNVK